MRKLTGKKVVRRSKRRKTVIASPVSLPPPVPQEPAPAAPSDTTAIAPVEKTSKPKKPFWDVGKGSKQYEQCMKVLALKVTGMSAADIGEAMGISKQSVHNLTYMAGKNDWLKEFANAREQIEYRIMPKVMRVIEEGLDDTNRHSTSGQTVAQQIALDVAGGTVFKQFEQVGTQAPPQTMIGVKIQIVPGTSMEMREGSGGGVPAYVEGDVTDVGRDE